jgi:hypothetical protein
MLLGKWRLQGMKSDAIKSYDDKTLPRKKNLSQDIGFKWITKDVTLSS